MSIMTNLERLKKLFIIDAEETVSKPTISFRFRCEFPGCESGEHFGLPDGWTQWGTSRFSDAPWGIANWCDRHTAPEGKKPR